VGVGGVVAAGLRPRRAEASDRIRIAVLGVSGAGRDHIKAFQSQPGAEVAILCDPDRNVADERALEFFDAYGKTVRVEQDLRRVFDNKEIDAVSVATPDHWHALAAIWACQAGKDVYIETPGPHTLWEGRRMVEAAHRYNRIVQHGARLRSSEAAREGVDLLRRGVIGRVYMARGVAFGWRPSIGRKPAETPPPHFDYNLWQGPAPERPFSRNIVPENWRWRWDYGSGGLGEACDEADLCLWGLGVGLPDKIASIGAKFLFDDDRETPETQTAAYLYSAQKKMIQLETRHWCTNQEVGADAGATFYGSEGYMMIGRDNRFETFLGPRRERGPARQAGGDHFANFLKAVRSRKAADQNAPVETAQLPAALIHLGNISHRLERRLVFDPAAERFVGDEQANALLSRAYRAPFVVPERV
jgi:predicted dehydrogenase